MNDVKRDQRIRIRECAACNATIVTALELAKHKRHLVPRGMRLFAGTFRDRPYCQDCIPAEGKHAMTV